MSLWNQIDLQETLIGIATELSKEQPYTNVVLLSKIYFCLRGRQNADMIGLPYYRVDITNHPYVMAVAALFNQSQVLRLSFI